jgi:hypothetical protein
MPRSSSKPTNNLVGQPGRGRIHFQAGELMKRYEYKLHHLTLQTGKSNDEQLLDALNRFGQEGWRLNRLYSDFSLRAIASWLGSLNFLLEREIADQA